MARYEKLDPDVYDELKALRQDVRDVFNKGQDPGEEIMEQLWFLDPKTRDIVERMTQHYDNVVTPDDFKLIAGIMSENLREQVPVLKDFTRFLGRLAEDFVINAKPSKSSKDWAEAVAIKFYGERKGEVSPLVKRLPVKPEGWLVRAMYGVRKKELPKKWTQIPWVNFDNKTIEQHFTQVFEERLVYRDRDGNWVTNILQVPQKTDPTFWDEVFNHEGKINDIVDASKARTAFAVNGNHSNDAVIVKRFHMWGKKNGIGTSTVHDAFVTNAAEMLNARQALREIYAEMVDTNPIKKTLDEMRRRGLPSHLYRKYLNEAIDIGLIPVPGRSKIGGRVMKLEDILTKEDILKVVPNDFKSDWYWYGVG
jgi:DNA-dependent RNA polymerase